MIYAMIALCFVETLVIIVQWRDHETLIETNQTLLTDVKDVLSRNHERLIETKPYTLIVEGQGECWTSPPIPNPIPKTRRKKHTFFAPTHDTKIVPIMFGRIGQLKPGETREESFHPDMNLQGGRFTLIAPDDVHVTCVYVGNDVFTMGESQLRMGVFPKVSVASRVRFLIERRSA